MHNRCVKDAKLSLIITVIAATQSSFSLCLIPFTSGIKEGESNIVAYIIAGVFWAGFILTLAASHLTKRTLFRCREKLISKDIMKKQKLPGVLNFSLRPMSIILYSVTVIGLVLIITDIIFSYVPELVMFPVISVTVLSFAVHCVIDGEYYKVYKLIKESVINETNH